MRSLRLFGFLAPLAAASLLSACSVLQAPITLTKDLTGENSVPKPAGLVVGDEPFAVSIGASTLSEGGSAADAATAMYFALAVTYPVAAGLGGGGICIVHDPKSGRSEQFDFPARAAPGGGAYAIPGNVRGFAQLQKVYGALPWQRDVAPAEGLAGPGFTISQALAARLLAAQDVIRLDADLAAEFMDESGRVKKAGMTVSNPALARTLAAIRLNGESGLYGGNIGATLLAYSSAQGGAISADELARYAVTRGNARAMQIGGQTVYLPDAHTGAGAFSGALFENMSQAMSAGSSGPQAVSAAVKQALARFGVSHLPKDLGATGFAAVDANGEAVSCAVTMNGPFGSGHSVTGTGVTLARAPSGDMGLAAAFLTPVIATDSSGAVTLAGAGAGGPNGAAAVGDAVARLAAGQPLTQQSDLRSTGVAPYDTVNVITCSGGNCFALPDPGANGMGAAADPITGK